MNNQGQLPDDIRKAQIESMLGGQDNNAPIFKAEGSRGGKVIGHTNSGKPIYEHHDHPNHKDFTSDDHDDAAKTHKKLSKEHNARSMGHATNKKEETREKDIAASHERKAKQHEHSAIKQGDKEITRGKLDK